MGSMHVLQVGNMFGTFIVRGGKFYMQKP